MRRSVRLAKRLFDTAGAAVGLALTVPFLPVVAAVIYIDSPGPIFYRQRRAGKLLLDGEPSPEAEGSTPPSTPPTGASRPRFGEFHMFKLRTMRTDAEKLTGAVLAAEGDPRITRVGRFLRKSRLDEVPQLWNVLRGEMSIIGPRPERPELLQNLAMAIPFFEERMRDVKPGITGLAQISLGYTGRPAPGSPVEPYLATLTNPFKIDDAEGSDTDDMRMKLLYDLAYAAALESFTSFMSTELGILFRTPWVMIRGLGR